MPSSSSLFYLPSLFLDCLSDWTGVSEPVISRILVYYLFATVAHYSWSVFTARPREKKTKQELSYDAEVIDTSTITAAKRARRSSTLKMPPSFSNKDDASILEYLQTGQVSLYSLETFLNDFERAVKIRRLWIGDKIKTTALDTDDLPYKNYDYSQIYGKCCESVIGFVPIPVGIAGPIKIDHQVYYVPMATTEGCLIASTSRGCKALMLSQGVTTEVYGDAMTRAPVLELPTAVRAVELKRWIESPSSWSKLKEAFESTSRFAKLVQIKAQICGKLAFVRFSARTGDAMGMNMVSKGVENTLKMLRNHFPDVEVISLSGNVCTDKKPSAVNWIEGRGKSVVAEATIPGEVLRKVLKTTSKDLVRLNTTKNLVGSAMAGSLGGFNAHAANIVTAVFAATGQDIAQNVESSSCLTLMECTNNDQDLYISCTMPSIEVGTIGGGTELLAQATNLHLLGVNGPNTNNPGENAERLARIVCATVLAGELSLCAALTVGDLVKSHMRLNRKQN